DHWQVDAAKLTAADGFVTGPGAEKLSFGALADAAAKRPVPKDVTLRETAAFKVVGKAHARLGWLSKVDGSHEYGIDVKLPGMKYAALAQPPVLGGKARTFDAAAAEKMPGVIKVVSTKSGVAVVAEHYWQAHRAREALKIDWEAG